MNIPSMFSPNFDLTSLILLLVMTGIGYIFSFLLLTIIVISKTIFGQTHNKIESALSYVYAEFVQTCRRTIIILEAMNLVDQIKVNLSCAIQCITMEVYQIYYRHVLCYRTDLGGMISIDCRCICSKPCIERPKKQILRSVLE